MYRRGWSRKHQHPLTYIVDWHEKDREHPSFVYDTPLTMEAKEYLYENYSGQVIGLEWVDGVARFRVIHEKGGFPVEKLQGDFYAFDMDVNYSQAFTLPEHPNAYGPHYKGLISFSAWVYRLSGLRMEKRHDHLYNYNGDHVYVVAGGSAYVYPEMGFRRGSQNAAIFGWIP